jgi:hypothetical protein
LTITGATVKNKNKNQIKINAFYNDD